MTNSNQLAIEALILERSGTLKLSRAHLIRRADFKNVAKGLRRLDELRAGELKSSASLIAGLPAALELPPEDVAEAIGQTQHQLAEARQIADAARDAAWRANFQPCAYLLGTETRPTQITFFGITGGSVRWLKIPLDLSKPPVTFAAQALTVVRRTPYVTFVNYTPDRAVRFNLEGRPVEAREHAYLPGGGDVMVTIGGKTIPAKTLGKIMGSYARG